MEVSGGTYGWQIDQEAEYNALTANIQNAETVTREPQYARRAASHEGNDYGSSYVEIDLTNQHVWVYVNGQCVVETDCVTGNPAEGNGTTPGSLLYRLQADEHNSERAEEERTGHMSGSHLSHTGCHLTAESDSMTPTGVPPLEGAFNQGGGSHGMCEPSPRQWPERYMTTSRPEPPVVCHY